MRQSRSLRSSYVLLAAVLAVGLVPFGSGVADADAPPPGTAAALPTLRWQACGEGFECAKLPVPLDHARPAGDTIELSLIRMPARQKERRIGSLVYLAGGPGASGVNLIRAFGADYFGAPLRDRFDIVGFDQRGVGGSAPVRCSTDGADGQRSTLAGRAAGPSAAKLAEITDAIGTFVQGCERLSGALLPYLSTEAAARDLDMLRAALGEEKLTALGASYGSELGATYASLFPTRLRALVLDAPLDPSLWINNPQDQLRQAARAFEAAFNAFIADCKARPTCGFGDGDPAGAYERLIKRLADQPILVTGKDTGVLGQVDAMTVVMAVFIALYNQSLWPQLADALERADEQNDGSGLLSFIQVGDNLAGLAASISIECGEQDYPTDITTYRRLADQLDQLSPHFGSVFAFSGLFCVLWPVEAASRYAGPFHAEGAPPILVIGTTGDPVTPYSWARSLADQLADGVLLTWRGPFTHGAYGRTSTCINQAVDRYLITTQPPANGTICTS